MVDNETNMSCQCDVMAKRDKDHFGCSKEHWVGILNWYYFYIWHWWNHYWNALANFGISTSKMVLKNWRGYKKEPRLVWGLENTPSSERLNKLSRLFHEAKVKRQVGKFVLTLRDYIWYFRAFKSNVQRLKKIQYWTFQSWS